MKRFFRLSLLSLALLALASCQKGEFEETAADLATRGKIYVEANIATDSSTRISMETLTSDDGNGGQTTVIKLHWDNAGETFDLLDGNNKIVATFRQTEDTTDAPNKFEGEFTPYGASIASEDSSEYTLVYPSANDVELSTQEGSLEGDNIMMCGTYTGTLSEMMNVNFDSHKTAIIRLSFKDKDTSEPIKDIKSVVVGGVKTKATLEDNSREKGTIAVRAMKNQETIYVFVPEILAEPTVDLTFTVITSTAVYNGELSTSKSIMAGKNYTATVNVSREDVPTLHSATIASESLSGGGTENNPYEISTPGDLLYLINNVSESEGKYYTMKTNINIAGDTPWTFALVSPFKGTLDGNGKVITGIINGYADSPLVVGFVCQNEGTIKDLNVNATVVGGGHVAELLPGVMGNGAGSIAGVNKGLISGCTSGGEVRCADVKDVPETGGYVGVGGIVGINLGNVENSNNSATVVGASISDCENVFSAAGGIVGASAGGNISDCENTGVITTGADMSNNGGGSIGTAAGILGFGAYMGISDIVITGCENSGTINGGNPINMESNVAGIAGCVWGMVDLRPTGILKGKSKIEGCSNSGSINGGFTSNYGSSLTAGIVASANMIDIIDCTNSGPIAAGEHTDRLPTLYLGGIAAMFSSDTWDEYFMNNASDEATAVKSIISGCENTATITGAKQTEIQQQFIGGIIGDLRDGHIIVTGNTNRGNITSETKAYVGGIIARCGAGWAVVSECYNHGEIDISLENSLVGGIIGDLWGRCLNGDDEVMIPGTVDVRMVDRVFGCINYGKLPIPTDDNQRNRCGGIVGDLPKLSEYSNPNHIPEVCNCCQDNSGYGKLIGNRAVGEGLTNGTHGCENTHNS